jgi:hypothetical protein
MLTTPERDYLTENCPGWLDFSDQDLYQATARMTIDLVFQRVRKERDDYRGTQAAYANLGAVDYFPVCFPRDKNTPHKMVLIGDGSGVNVYKKEVWQDKHVAVLRDALPAFCQLHHLDLARMTEMLNGDAKEHRGFRRWNGGNLAADGWSGIPGRALGSPPPQFTQEDYAERWGKEDKPGFLDRPRQDEPRPTVYWHAEPTEVFTG